MSEMSEGMNQSGKKIVDYMKSKKKQEGVKVD
jgi:hypothetical protein